MSHVVRLTSSLYSRLEKHAKGFDTPVNVIERILDYYEGRESKGPVDVDSGKPNFRELGSSPRTHGNSVEAWRECAEIALGFKSGSTHLDDSAPFLVSIYKKFSKGEPAYGVSGVNMSEALLQVFEEYEPDNYELALEGLRKTLQQSDKPFHKMRELYRRRSGRDV